MTTEQKKYTDVVRLGHKSTQGVLNEGDFIVVMEKLDGANASFKREGNVLRVFSRNTELDESNNLRGFYQWVHENVKLLDLIDGFIYFGEWLVRHKVDYGQNGGQQFYLFDVYNPNEEEYLPFLYTAGESERLGLQMVPVFYAGKYKGYDHLAQFIGKSVLTESGEGIVVKNNSYRDRHGNQMYVKLVSEAFAEMQPQKPPRDPNAPQSPEALFIKTYMTPARVEKLLLKLVDEGELREDFDLPDMSTILRNLGGRVYDDIMKEELTNIPDGYEEKEARKTVGKILPLFVKKIIQDKEDKSLATN